MTESSNKQENICIIIPCYNEEQRLPISEYEKFLSKESKTILCFVNDGSTDNTQGVLLKLKQKFDKNVAIVSYKDNVGKAEAVRKGILYSNEKFSHDAIAYLDADLATSLDECVELSTYLDSNISFVFGSRIMKIGSVIVRNHYRFLIGRVIATFISKILKLKVYDTQCGCKIFDKALSETIFKDPFISKWLFDVEIFQRIILLYGRQQVLNKMIEIPLKRWIDKDGSKVKISYFFKMLMDLYSINKKYKAQNFAAN
jgi:glycosyltransferase involved in cell wall biosynthesis